MRTPGTIGLAEAAAELGEPYYRAYNLLLTGALDGGKQSGKWRVTRTSVERLLREREVEKTAAVA